MRSIFNNINQILFVVVTLHTYSYCQIGNYSQDQDKLSIEIDEKKHFYCTYFVNKKVSLYKFTQQLGISLQEVLKYNKLKSDQNFELGEEIKVPIPTQKITFSNKYNSGIALAYKIKKGDTFYHLTKNVFNIDSQTFKKLNNKADTELNIDEYIIIGYYNIPAIIRSNESNVVATTPLEKKIITEPDVEEITEENTSVTKWFQNDVIAYWDKKNTESNSLFVLHNEAKIGSIIEIYFPMRRRTAKAKVLGKLPIGTYSADIDMILSPGLAKELGILDSRCRVNIKYEAQTIVALQE